MDEILAISNCWLHRSMLFYGCRHTMSQLKFKRWVGSWLRCLIEGSIDYRNIDCVIHVSANIIESPVCIQKCIRHNFRENIRTSKRDWKPTGKSVFLLIWTTTFMANFNVNIKTQSYSFGKFNVPTIMSAAFEPTFEIQIFHAPNMVKKSKSIRLNLVFYSTVFFDPWKFSVCFSY